MSINVNAFAPLGITVSFTAATPSPPTAVQALTGDSSSRNVTQYRIVNAGAVTVLLGVGNTAAEAAAAALTIAAGAIPILAGTCEVMGFTAGKYFTGLSASGTAVVYVTPGEGI